MKPTDPTVLIEMGLVFETLSRYDDAVALYRQILVMNTSPAERADAFQRLGRTDNDMKEYAKALSELKQAEALKPAAATSELLGDAYAGLQDYANALTAYQDAVRLKRTDADAHFKVGKTYQALQEFDKAVVPFREVTILEPKSARGFNELGRTYFRLHRFADAASALEQAIARNEKDPAMHVGLGMSYRAMGRREEAMRVYQTLTSLDAKLAQQLLDAIERRQ